MTTSSPSKLKLSTGWLLLTVCVLQYQRVACSGFDLNTTAILDAHNFIRRNSMPNGADMKQLVWNYSIADLAQKVAEKCQYGILNTTELAENITNYNTNSSIGVNMGARHEAVFKGNLEEFISEWSLEGQFYDYYKNVCTSLYCRCARYLQLVWGSADYVGCAVTTCPELNGFWISQDNLNAVFFVCLYGPSALIPGTPPYVEGMFCTKCPITRRTCINNLCAPTEESKVTDDPHFMVHLPGGQLCFSVQGDDGKIYNLFTNDLIEVNAKFILAHHRHTANTWIGSVGMYALGQSFTFDILEEKIMIGKKTSLYSYNVSSISLVSGHFHVQYKQIPSGKQMHNVEVDLEDVGMKFIVSFVNQNHLNLYWHIHQDNHQEANEGIVGQYYRPGTEIDEVNGVLHLTRQHSVPVRYKRVSSTITGHCWTTKKHTEQMPGFEKQSHDYEVHSLVAHEFKFGNWEG